MTLEAVVLVGTRMQREGEFSGDVSQMWMRAPGKKEKEKKANDLGINPSYCKTELGSCRPNRTQQSDVDSAKVEMPGAGCMPDRPNQPRSI